MYIVNRWNALYSGVLHAHDIEAGLHVKYQKGLYDHETNGSDYVICRGEATVQCYTMQVAFLPGI